MNETCRAAIQYARRGIPVFPCNQSKEPMTNSGFYAATVDDRRIKAWFDVPGPPLIGIPTGQRSGIWALDLDRKNGVDGSDSLDKLTAAHGPLPDTPVSLTPSGGMHLLFRFADGCHVRNSTGRLGPGIDVRGEGGYIIAPPSRLNGQGVGYEWEASSPPEIVPAPAWLESLASPPAPRERRPYREPTDGDRRRALEALQAIVFSADEGRDTWVEIGMAYRAAGGCVESFETWSASQPGYDADKFPREWDSWSPEGGITPGTLYYHARRFGWDFPRSPAPAGAGPVDVGDMGLEPVCDKEGEFKGWRPTLSNVAAVLELHEHWHGRITHNQLAGRGELADDKGQRRELDDAAVHEVRIWLDTGIQWAGGKPSRSNVFDAIEAVCQRHQRHPVQEYLESLQWDGMERLPFWLEDVCGVARSQYTIEVATKTLVGAVARAYVPGCKLDTMLVLVGPQGIMKSTMLRILAISEEWHVDTPIPLGNKDAYQTLGGAWLYEFAELAAMHGKDVEKLKAFFSSATDHYRAAYARLSVPHPRGCFFVATTNDGEFLHDSTGARRFWVVEVQAIDIGALKAVVEQLWAEAVYRYRQGEEWHLSPEAAEESGVVADEHYSADPWEDAVTDHVTGLENITGAEVLDALEVDRARQGRGDLMRVSRILRDRLGWVRVRVRRGSRNVKGWRRP